MGILTDQLLSDGEQKENPVEPAGNLPVVPLSRPAPSSGLARDILGETEEATRLDVAAKTSTAIPHEKAARTLELGDKTGLPLDLITRNFDEVDVAARGTEFDPVKFRAESPAVAKWMAEDPNNAALAREDLAPLSMTERLVESLRAGVINRSYDLVSAQTRLGKLRARQIEGQVLSADESREAEELSRNMETMGKFAESGLPWVAKTVLSGGIQSVQAVVHAQDMALQGAAGGAGASLLAGPAAPALAPGTTAAGYGFGLQLGLMRETYQVEAGQAYDEFLKIRGEDGQPIDPEVAKMSARVVGALNAPLELLAFRSIVKTVPGGARALAFVTKDGIKAALEKQSVRTAIATALKTFGEAGVENAVQEALQETTVILAAETSKALSPGKFESPTPGEQVKRVAGAAAGGAVMGIGLGLPGTISQINSDFGRARKAAQNEATFKALGEAVAESKTFQRLPAKTQEIVARMTKDGPLETLYTPVDTWNTYWQDKGVEPRAMAREILGDVKAYDEAVAGGRDIAIPTELYATKLAPTEHNEFFQSELRTDPEGMNAREANEFVTQIEAVSAEADVTKPVNEAAGRVGADIQLQLQASGFDEQTSATYSQLYSSAFQAMGERTGQDPFELYQRYGLKIQRGDETTLGRARAAASDLEGAVPARPEGPPVEGAAPAQSISPTIGTPGAQTSTGPGAVAPGKGAAQAGMPVHQPTGPGPAAESAYRPRASFSESITSHPNFRKYFADANAVVGKYAEFFGRKLTPKFALEIGQEIHVDARAAFTGETAADREKGKARFEKKYKGLDSNEVGKDMLLLRAAAQGILGMSPGAEVYAEEYVKGRLDAYTFDDRPLAALEADPDVMRRARALLNQAQTERQDKMTRIEEFIIENGGLRIDATERGEFADVAVRLRGEKPKKAGDPDVRKLPSDMEQMAKEQGILPEGTNLYRAISEIKKRGEKPVLSQFVVEAAREQEHDQEFFQDLFETQAAGAGQRYEAYVKVATDRGLSGVQARKFALDRLAREGGKPEASPTSGTQLEIGDPEGVKSFGKGARGQSELFQDAMQDQKKTGPVRAVFLGWQEMGGLGDPVPLYNIRGEHKSSGSTVGTDTLKSMGIEVPATPTFEAWKAAGSKVNFDQPANGGGKTPPTWKLKKIKDFKTDEGKFSVYGTENVRGKDSMFTVIRDKGGFIVRNALVPKDMQRQGLATELYIRMNGESMKETGKPLRSTKPRTLFTGETVHEVSDEAVALWESFVSKGWAVKNGEKDYSFRPEAVFSQRKGNEKRGRIRFGADRQFSIDLLRKADLSTFLHETGHFFLEVMGDLSEGKDAPADVKADFDAILKFLDVKSKAGIGMEQHEKFARSFEAYLMEGKAPSPGLRQAFARFRAWLISVYQTLKSLNTELTPEVRQVFDRLTATKEEIGQAEAEAGLQPLFEDPRSVGMNEAKAQAYTAAVTEARDAAEEELTSRVLRDFNRERKKIWKDTREQIRGEVEAEVNQRKEFIALSVLQRGVFPGGEALPEGMARIKLSKAAIVSQWGAERLKSLPMPYVYSAEGGVHPDQAAEIFGFTSGDELLKALVNAGDRKALIEAMTDEQMRAEFGDVLKDGKVPEEAMKAVHGQKRAQLLQMELEHLASNDLPVLKEVVRRVSRRIPTLAAVTAQAEKIIAAKAVRDLAPTAYRQAETRAARAATEAMLRGDFAAAFDFKQKELLNHELFTAATRAREEVEGIVEYMGRFNKPSVRERLGKAGGDYLAQIDAILDRYDFRRSTSLTAIDKRKSLLAWVQEQHDQGQDVEIPEKLLNEAYRRHYKDTAYEELQGVRDSVQTIEHLARLKGELLANEKLRDLEAARDTIVASITAHHEIKKEPLDFAPGFKARLKEKAREGVAAHTRMEFLFEFLDGNKPQGATWQALFKPMADAENAENDMVHEAGKAVSDIFSAYTRKERIGWFLEKTHIAEIGTSMNKANMLAVALNWGNEYNRQALMDGYGWNEGQVQAILQRLDSRDWDTVQRIWDYIDSYWPQIEAMEKKLNGVAPKKVERAAFTAPGIGGREMAGGYYPIVFDSKLSWRQNVLEEAANVKDMFGGNWSRAMTRKGHTIERTNTGGKPLRLELTGLTQHLTNVIHDLAFRPAVIDASKIARDPDVRLAIEGAAGREMYRQINPWLSAIAGDRRGDPMNPIEGLLGRARAGVTTVALGLKLTSGIVQTLGYFNTIREVGAQYAGRGLRDVFSRPTELRKTWGFITDRSDMMRSRIENYDRDVRDVMKKLSVEGATSGPLGAIDAYTMDVRRSFFSFIGLMDLAVSVPTWLAGYSKAMDGKVENVGAGDEGGAIDYADSVVRKTQSAGAAKDLAGIQRGSEAFKIFTMFYSQLSLQFNQMASSVHQYRLDGNMGRLAASAALLWFIPAVMEDVLRGRTPGADDEPEKWATWFARKQALYPFNTVVLVRDLANAMERYLETGTKDFQGSPIFDVGESLVGLASLVTKPLAGEDVSRADIKNAVMAAGYVFQLPTRQTWQTLEYLYDWMTGATDHGSVMEGVWRALVAGKKRD